MQAEDYMRMEINALKKRTTELREQNNELRRDLAQRDAAVAELQQARKADAKLALMQCVMSILLFSGLLAHLLGKI